MASLSWLREGSGLVTKADLCRFMKECLMKAGAPEENAATLAENLLIADYWGRKCYGFNCLDLHIKEIQSGHCNPSARPVILSETPATAWVDGCNGLGVVVGNFCMQLAIAKAEDMGVGVVSARGTNNFGLGSCYATQAVREGYIGFCCSNTSPCMVPTRAKNAFLGSNPLCLAAPSLSGEIFMIDMRTSTVALERLEMMHTLGRPLPRGWAYDSEGRITTDPAEALRSQRLTPLGGTEETGGFKGSGLSFMVESLCGILAGGPYGIDVPKSSEEKSSSNLSQFFMAINPDFFASQYESRVFDMMCSFRETNEREAERKTMLGGDLERAHMKKVDCAGGISYHSKQLARMRELAETLDVAPVQIM